MKYFPVEQGSDAWWKLHCSVPTASNFNRVLTPVNRKPSASQKGFMAELIGNQCSLYTPPRVENYTSRAIEHGLETEAEARNWYAMERNVEVANGGFCFSDDGRFGCSPDGLIGLFANNPTDGEVVPAGGLELKCPQSNTQAGYLLDGQVLPDDYKGQVHGALIVTGAPWWDFCSYHPGLPPVLVRVFPDDYTEALKAELDRFYEKYITALKRMKGESRA